MESHEKSRRGLCLICAGKAKLVIERGSKYEQLVNAVVIDGYWASEYRLPCGLCHSCRKKLEEFGKGIFTSILLEYPDFSAMRTFSFRIQQATSVIEGQEKICPCVICARYKICATKKWMATSTKLKRGQHHNSATDAKDATPKAKSICVKCFGRIFEFVTHNCNTKTAVNNIQTLVPSMLLQKTASRLLTDLTDSDGRVILSTGGRKVAYRKVSPTSSFPKPSVVPATAIRPSASLPKVPI